MTERTRLLVALAVGMSGAFAAVLCAVAWTVYDR
jgi:hypothetical protein